MGCGVQLFVLVALVHVYVIVGLTNPDDSIVLQTLKQQWTNVPPNWKGADDPCGNGWDGIKCSNNRVVSITLASINLSGQLTSDIQRLSELQTLDLSYNKGLTGSLPSGIGDLKKLTSLILVGCGLSGSIPSSIGSLQRLVFLSLNSNSFTGGIPPSIGDLSKLYWLDLADNKLTGPIPVSDGTTTAGLDMLLQTKHFHFGGNQLSGAIPSQLFSSNMSLSHLLLENNQLTGTIPSTLALVQKLEVVRLDRNSLSGDVPQNLNNLTSVQELYLSNNQLTGLLPDLTGMDMLNYVDMSNNSFDPSEVPSWFSSLESLTSLIMESTQVHGELPVSLFSLFQLQTVILKNNRVDRTLNIGSTYSSQLQLIDLQDNFIDAFTQRTVYNITIILEGNPVCSGREGKSYCTISRQSDTTYSTPPGNCAPVLCDSDMVSSPTCKCSYPYTGNLVFRAPSFSSLEDSSIFTLLNDGLMNSFQANSLAVDSVALSNPTKNLENYLVLSLQVFPSGQEYFNYTGITSIGFLLSNQTFKPPRGFGPYYFIGNSYPFNTGNAGHKSKLELIIGIIVAFIVLLLGGATFVFKKNVINCCTKTVHVIQYRSRTGKAPMR